MNIVDKLTGKISEKIVEKIAGEDNRNISDALIELIIEVKANFINESPSLSVSFPVPIEDEYHKVSEYKFLGEENEDSDRDFKIEDGIAILNFRKKYNKGDKEGCKIYFKLKNQAYKSVRDNSNPDKFLNFGKYCILSDDTKKFIEQFRVENSREIIYKISTWIFLNLRYSDIDEMKSAEWLFKNRIGNCVHYSTLFIAFCRYFEIPSRYVLGFVKYGKFYPHTWAEFYDWENFSWIPMDLSLNQKFFVDATHIPISRFGEGQIKRYFKEVNLEIPKNHHLTSFGDIQNLCDFEYDECFKIVNFGTEIVVKEDAHVEINVKGKLI
ncbi:MAG: hypothetical protein BWK75_06535 [Candidatus Altiarchaeales archaeon A3]|nr:MAG: hypothetical protein BWK75_06535 [Candidatus Altiarchaeales archaeon A3]